MRTRDAYTSLRRHRAGLLYILRRWIAGPCVECRVRSSVTLVWARGQRAARTPRQLASDGVPLDRLLEELALYDPMCRGCARKHGQWRAMRAARRARIAREVTARLLAAP